MLSCSLYANDKHLPVTALEHYDKGNYGKSIEAYHSAIKQGIAPGNLYYNLGNAYYRNEQIGAAMASFLAARRYLPRDPDIKANLKYVHSQLKDNLDIELNKNIWTVVGFWIGRVTKEELLNIFFILFASGFFLLFIARVVVVLKGAKNIALVLVVCSLFVLGAYQVSNLHDDHWGAVIKDRIEVRSSPGKDGSIMFKLHQGAPFVVKAESPEWVKILLSDSQKGWVAKQDILFFR
jgi:tetratricopeptide (TPR) repeat protein